MTEKEIEVKYYYIKKSTVKVEYVDKDKIIYNGTTYVRDTSYDSEQ